MFNSRILQFCVNHSFLLNRPNSKIYDEQFINYFKEIKSQLENFLEYYKKYNEKSVDSFKKTDVKEYTKNFVLKLSQYLNLSCDVCFEVFKAYLLSDGKLADNDLQSMLTRGYNTISLMQKIKKFYYEERLSLIRIMRYAFCDWKEEFLILSKIVLSASGFEKKTLLFSKLLTSYKWIISEISHDKTSYEYRDENTEDEIIMQSLEEQVELLETMLIAAYSMKDCRETKIFQEVLGVFQETGFFSNVNILKIFSSRTYYQNISERIRLIQSLVLIELAGIDNMFVSKEELLSKHFLSDGKSLSQLNGSISKFGYQPSHSILLLFMSLMRNNFPIDSNSCSISSGSMAETAISKLSLFSYLQSVLGNKPYLITATEGSYLGLIVHCVLFNLLSLLCHEIHLNSIELSIRQDLIKAMCVIVKPIILFSETQPLNGGFMKMLEDLSLSFPANLNMINLIGCLMKKSNEDDDYSDDEIIEIVADFIENLSWFADCRCIDMDMDCVVVDGGPRGDYNSNSVTQCRLIKPYQPYFSLTLTKDSEGYLLDGNAVWAVKYSVWDVISAEVDLTCQLIQQNYTNCERTWGPANIVNIQEQLDRLEIILEFLCTALECGVRTNVVITNFQKIWIMVHNGSLFIDGCEPLLIKIINLSAKVLNNTEDKKVISSIVSVKNLFPNAQFTATERIVSNQSIVENIWKNEPTPINMKIIQAYLKFNVSLIHCEKYLETEIGAIPSSVIFGSIIFVIKHVLDNLTKRVFTNSSDVTDLAADCLVFLAEILSIKPKSYLVLSDSRKNRLELIQQVTHEILVNTPSSIKTILAISCLDIEILQKQSNISNQMLGIFGTEDKLSQLVWVALTLVKYIFIGPELNKDDQIVIESGASLIMKLLDTNENETFGLANISRKRRATMTYSQQYVQRMLEFLTYPYSIKIARMSLDVLKLIVQNTNLSIAACLGEKISVIRDMLLRICSSSMEDQIVRANLFDFLSECVMCGRHGVLQLIGSNKSDIVTENSYYQSCISIISDFKLGDEISVKLICSVSKFFASLWIKECYSAVELLKSLNIWTVILVPINEFLKNLCEHKEENNEKCPETQLKMSINDQLFNFLGDVYGLFGMELYSNSALLKSQKDTNFIKSFESLFSLDLYVKFLSVFDQHHLESRDGNIEKYMSLLIPSIIWWKTLLVTVLSVNPDVGIKGFTLTEEIDLTSRILNSISNLLSYSVINETPNLIAILDHLSYCVLQIIYKRVKQISEQQNTTIFKHLIDVTRKMLPSPSATYHARHTDLLTACVLLQYNHVANPSVKSDIELLSESYLFDLTTKLSLTKLESKVLIEAINLVITTDVAPDNQINREWVTRLADSGILHNSFVVLNDCIKKKDLTILPQTIMLLLLRVAHTHIGASRINQSFLLRTLETDIILNETDSNAVTFMCQLLQLAVVLIDQNGPMSHEFGFRIIFVYWDKLYSMVKDGCQRLSRVVNSAEDYDRIGSYLTIGHHLFDLIWSLLTVRGTWSMYWPMSLITELEQLLQICVNTIAVILSQPKSVFIPNSAYIIFSKLKTKKQVQLSLPSPKVKMDHSSSLDDFEQPLSHMSVQLASSRLESVLYKLLHSSLSVYSRSTLVASEYYIYEGIDYNGGLLNESFGECRIENCNVPLSFGTLFNIINSTHYLLREDIPPIMIDNEKISFNGDLMRQIHEIVLATIVSHSVIYLTKFDNVNKTNKSTFISNLRSELNLYLSEFGRTRRRNTLSSSSPLNVPPRLTSTPYSRKHNSRLESSTGLSENFDSFCAGIDYFMKALDLM